MEPVDVGQQPAGNDARLAPLLAATDDTLAGHIEQLLASVVRPVLSVVLSRALRGTRELTREDTDDLSSAIQLRLLERLRRLRTGHCEPIEDLEKYVAALAYNAVNDHLRRRFPERARHKNRLRRLLMDDARLARWHTASGIAAGLREWTGSEDVLTIMTVTPASAMRDRDSPADALVAIFRATGRPVAFETLVSLTAELWHVVDLSGTVETDALPAHAAEASFESRELLQMLWTEVQALRPLQRQALLLNLRENETANAIALLTLTGIASFEEVAAAVDMTPDDLAAVWNDLPLDDLRIAARLGVTRQQVINLRKSARERLTRRLKR